MYLLFKNTGEKMHVQNAQARAFIAAGLAEAVQDPNGPGAGNPPAPPKWSVITYVTKGKEGRAVLAIKLEVLGRVEYFSGDPKNLSARIFGGLQPPADVVQKYREDWKSQPHLRPEPDPFDGLPVTNPNEKIAQDKAEADRQLREGRVFRAPAAQVLE